MTYITTPSKAYKDNESFGGVENIQNLQSAVETGITSGFLSNASLGIVKTIVSIYRTDSSIFFKLPDTSIFYVNAYQV